jgi:hypothetical protein
MHVGDLGLVVGETMNSAASDRRFASSSQPVFETPLSYGISILRNNTATCKST